MHLKNLLLINIKLNSNLNITLDGINLAIIFIQIKEDEFHMSHFYLMLLNELVFNRFF